MTRARPNRGDAGFTLVELVVCLGLLALTTTWLLQGAPLVTRAADVIAGIEQEDSARAAQMHLRRTLERAVPFFTAGENGEAELAFQGKATSLRFVTRSDGRLEAGGLILAELRTEQMEDHVALVTERRSLAPGQDETEPEVVVLMEPVTSVTFQYYGQREHRDDVEWAAEWTGQSMLPRLVRVDIQFPETRPQRPESVVVALPAASFASPGE